MSFTMNPTLPTNLGAPSTSTFPGMLGASGAGASNQNGVDLAQYAMRYFKGDLDDPGAKTEAEMIETRAILPDGGIILISQSTFTFMDKMFVVLRYLEKTT